jgi:hypothetical protein
VTEQPEQPVSHHAACSGTHPPGTPCAIVRRRVPVEDTGKAADIPVNKPEPDGDDDKARIKRRIRISYRLTVSLITARDDRPLMRQCIQDAADDMPQNTYGDLLDIARMYASAALMATQITGSTATALDRREGEGTFDQMFRAGLRLDLLNDDDA